MTSPEEALAKAREAADRKRAEGSYPPPAPGALEDSITAEVPDLDLVAEWAVIAVDPDLVYSTRHLGAPVTGLKRVLMRLFRQYHVELEAQQTRFNIALVAHLRDLERRLDGLERSRGG